MPAAPGRHAAIGIVGVAGAAGGGDGVGLSPVGVAAAVHRGDVAYLVVGVGVAVGAGDGGESVEEIVGEALGLTGYQVLPLGEVAVAYMVDKN